MQRAIVALAVLLMASTSATTEKIAKIGFLSWWSPTMSAHLDYLRDGLRELGYVDGKNIEIVAHFAAGDRTRTRELARTLVEQHVDVLVVQTGVAARIAQETTRTIPIVMAPVAAALGDGLVDNLAHPGGNVTGILTLENEFAEKWIQYLRDIRPGLRSVGFVGIVPPALNLNPFLPVITAAANRAGVKLVVRLVDNVEAIDPPTFDAMKHDGVEAVVVQPVFTGYQEQIVPLAARAGLPTVSSYAVFAEAGALLTYGIDDRAIMRRAAYYVDRILKDTKPADLPIEQPTTFQLVINLRAAKLFGWTIPPSLLLRADRIIE